MKTLLPLIFALIWTTHASAAPEYVPAQELAQGQSLAGGSLLNDSLYSNPASSAFTKTYNVEGAYLGSGGFAASVLDTRTSMVGGALGYFRKPVDYSDENIQGAKLGLSTMLTPTMAAGISGKIIWGPGADSQNQNLKDMDMGVGMNFGSLSIGAMVRNVFGGNSLIGMETEWGLGGKINWQKTLSLSVATYGGFETMSPDQVGIGVEYISPYYFSLKSGYRIRPSEDFNAWSLGASFLAPKLAIHYGVEFAGADGLQAEHIISISVMM